MQGFRSFLSKFWTGQDAASKLHVFTPSYIAYNNRLIYDYDLHGPPPMVIQAVYQSISNVYPHLFDYGR